MDTAARGLAIVVATAREQDVIHTANQRYWIAKANGHARAEQCSQQQWLGAGYHFSNKNAALWTDRLVKGVWGMNGCSSSRI